MPHPLKQIEQLQSWRGRKGADLSIARLVEHAADDATRVQQRLGQLIELWRELMPEPIVSHTALAGLRNGVLQVKVDSAATAFEVDRLLKGGVEAQLRKRYRGTLSRVKTRVEALDAEPHGPAARRARPDRRTHALGSASQAASRSSASRSVAARAGRR